MSGVCLEVTLVSYSAEFTDVSGYSYALRMSKDLKCF